METILQEAINDKKLAAIVLGQAIVDEGTIGTDSVKLLYHSEELAKSLWELGKQWNWVNSFQTQRYIDNRKPNETKYAWVFNFKKPAIKEIYEIIGSLPEGKKDIKIKRFLRLLNQKPRYVPNLKEELLKTISISPKTIENIMDELNISSHMARDNLRILVREGKAFTKRINGYGKLIYFPNQLAPSK